jgi:hypothetical protein
MAVVFQCRTFANPKAGSARTGTSRFLATGAAPDSTDAAILRRCVNVAVARHNWIAVFADNRRTPHWRVCDRAAVCGRCGIFPIPRRFEINVREPTFRCHR